MWDRPKRSRVSNVARICSAVALTVVASCGGDNGGEDAGSSAATVDVTSSVARDDTTAATAGQSSPSDVSAIGALLVTEEDGDSLFGNGDPPIREGEEYYEPSPEQLCDGGVTAAMLADDDVFNLLDGYDDWVFFGQWISSEAIDDAATRFESGAEVITSCLDISYTNDDGATIEFVPLAIEDSGLDDVEGLTVVRDGEPIFDFVYARQGGLITAMYFDYRGYTWPEEEKAAVLDVAIEKLIDAEP
jgi:hypothetical protein